MKKQNNIAKQTAVLGAGCFWSVESIFKRLKGVFSVVPGYADGNSPRPTYEKVSLGSTGHAETVKIEFDPTIISYADLIDVFFNIHDPTTLNRQANDVGQQYRSIILYASEEQKKIAEKSISQLEAGKIFDDPIVTEVKPLVNFFPAEDYHQSYYEKNQNQPYCQLVIGPKLKNLEQKFSHLLKDHV